MIFHHISRFFARLNEILSRPFLVVWLCLLMAFISLVVEGSLFQLWSLHQSDREMSRRILLLEEETKVLSMKISRASDPDFLDLEASEYFDVVEEGDLIFVFSEEVDDVSYRQGPAVTK